MSLIQSLAFVARHPLNHSKVAAFGRVASWQVRSRIMTRPVAVPFVNDTRIHLERGETGATGNWYCGLHEAGEMAFVLHALRPGDLFADIGANVGSYTVLGMAAGVRVVSVEPIPATFAKLEANIALNTGEVRAENCGVSSAPGILPFVTSLGSCNRVAEPGEASVGVPVAPLDQLLPETPAIMKIDVEGHEGCVIHGAARTLTDPNLKAVVMETFDSHAADLRARMARFGFAPFAYDPLRREIAPLTGPALNAIFLRDPAEMQAYCKAAPRYRLVNGWV